MKKAIAICLVGAGLILTGCENMKPGQTLGSLAGGAGGALIGSQIGHGKGRLLATGVGAVVGSLIGGAVGSQMDQKDRSLAQENASQTLEYAPNNSVNTWKNPNTGRYGQSSVVNTNYRGQEPCRTLTTVTYDYNGVEIGQETRTYCRDRFGHWVPY